MKKSIISLALVLAIVLSMSCNVFAANTDEWESEIDVVGVAAVNNVYYDTLQDAVNNANGNIVTLLKDSTETVTTNGVLKLDLHGFSASNVEASTIYAYDSSASIEAAGTGKLVTASTVEVLTENAGTRYVALKGSENTYTVHAFKLNLKDVNLRTEQAGINYTAELICDETLEGAVQSHGIVLSLKDMPGDDFRRVSTDAFTVYNGAPTGEIKSGYVYNIFKSDLKDATNTKRGECKIYANAYLCLNDTKGTIVMADTANVGNAWSEGYTGDTCSLKDVMVELNEKLANYSEQLEAIVKFYTGWESAMAGWSLDDIAAEAAKAGN